MLWEFSLSDFGNFSIEFMVAMWERKFTWVNWFPVRQRNEREESGGSLERRQLSLIFRQETAQECCDRMLKCEATLQANCPEIYSMLQDSELKWEWEKWKRAENYGKAERESFPTFSPPVHDRHKLEKNLLKLPNNRLLNLNESSFRTVIDRVCFRQCTHESWKLVE